MWVWKLYKIKCYFSYHGLTILLKKVKVCPLPHHMWPISELLPEQTPKTIFCQVTFD